ncbi:MAG: hypothetical protein CVV02_02350 [Firmicutes bacterium HGW-Firmicutes-7]|nr:MAG: hypothetical protein CVV02_02350 [Firmicutes bacterium HGW-Firmicutes-7]
MKMDSKKIKFKKWSIGLAIFLCVIVGALIISKVVATSKSSTILVQSTEAVVKGDLSVNLSGSGAISPSSRETLSSSVEGTIITNNIEDGKYYNQGDILIELDKTDILMNLEDAENNLLDKQLSLQEQQDSIAALNVLAPFDGTVTDIHVKIGDKIKADSILFTISNQSQLTTSLPFISSAITEMKVGDTINLQTSDYYMVAIVGTIISINENPYFASVGSQLNDVEILINNPGLLKEGMEVTGEWSNNGRTFSSINPSSLLYYNSKIITSNEDGDVSQIFVKKNQTIAAGSEMIQLTNNSLEREYDSANLKLKNQEYQLQVSQSNLQKYTIYAPIDGYVINSETLTVGSELKSGSRIAEIIKTDSFTFDISVDELDISKVSIGQIVHITLDAIESTIEAPIEGMVTNIAIDSSSENGVTTYPVTVSFSSEDGILGGMNADGEILLEEKVDTLYVPIEAVTTKGNRSFVYLKDGASSDASSTDTGNLKPNEKNLGTTEQSNIPSSSDFGAERTMTQRNREKSVEAPNSQASSSDNFFSKFVNKLKGGGGDNTLNYYEGSVMVPVETGINNELYIEIISGLSEGDEVILPQTSESTSTSQSSQFGGMGGGGMPAGGIPGGNMR